MSPLKTARRPLNIVRIWNCSLAEASTKSTPHHALPVQILDSFYPPPISSCHSFYSFTVIFALFSFSRKIRNKERIIIVIIRVYSRFIIVISVAKFNRNSTEIQPKFRFSTLTTSRAELQRISFKRTHILILFLLLF